MCPAARSSTRPSGNFRPSLMMVFKSEPSGFADNMRPPLRSRKKSRPDVGAFFAPASIDVEAIALIERTSSLTFLCILDTGYSLNPRVRLQLLLAVTNTVVSILELSDVTAKIKRQAAHLLLP